jgi:hypothetical protein
MQSLAFFFLAPVLIATLGATAADPPRPADGTYVYAIVGTPALTSSTVVVRTDGGTVSTTESVSVAGAPVVATTQYATDTLLPTHYRVVEAGTTTDVAFSGTTATVAKPPLTFRANPGTDLLAVGDGMVAYVAMLPSVLAAHPGRPVSLLGLNGGKVVTVRSVPPTEARPADVPAADIAGAIEETENGLTFSYRTDPRTNAVAAIDVAGLTIRLLR